MKRIEKLRQLPVEDIAKLITTEELDYKFDAYSFYNKLDGTLSDNYYSYDDALNDYIEYLNSEYEEEKIEQKESFNE